MAEIGQEQAAGEAGRGDARPHWTRPTPLKVTGVIAALLVLAIVIFLLIFQWDWLRGPLARFASAKIHRTVKIDGHLRVRLLTWSPTATVGGVKVGNAPWAGPRNMAEVGTVKVAIHLPSLLKGRGVMLPIVSLDHPTVNLLQDAQGRANWDFSDGKKQTGKAAKIPPIQQFVINDGHIQVQLVARKLELTGTVNAHEQRGGGGDSGFSLTGNGAVNRRPFTMKVSGGPLLNIRADRPYPFDADLRAGDTRLTARGSVTRPFDFASLQATVALAGTDLADLYYLTGVTLPNTPPYAISGRLARRDTAYDFNQFKGRVGHSDIGGDLSIDLAGGRPKLTGHAVSRVLDFKDLGALFGAGSRAKGATVAQKATANKLAAQSRLLPDATLDIARARAMDAKFDYRAASILAPGLPLRQVHIGVGLDHGLLDLDPISLDLSQGRLSGTARIDARTAVQKNAIDLRLTGLRLEDFIKTKGQPPLEGVVQARARLTGTGDSVHKAAATADGNVTALVPNGRIKQVFAELIGVNAIKGLGLLLSKDTHDTPVRCALVDFKATNGVLSTQTAVFDTDPSVVRGSGSIDLNNETLDLRAQGSPKKFQLIHFNVPVTVTGPLRKPAVAVHPGPAILQAGASVAIGVLASPLAVIIPFLDAGGAKGADCAQVFAQARARGAPTKVPPPPRSAGR